MSLTFRPNVVPFKRSESKLEGYDALALYTQLIACNIDVMRTLLPRLESALAVHQRHLIDAHGATTPTSQPAGSAGAAHRPDGSSACTQSSAASSYGKTANLHICPR